MPTVAAPEETRSIYTIFLRTAFPASLGGVVKNYAAAASLLVIGFAAYSALFQFVEVYHEKVFTPLGFAAIEVVLIGYLAFLPLFYATFPDDYAVKCRLFWRAVANLRRRRPTEPEAVALRAVAVKAFFMPLMIAWLANGLTAFILALAGSGHYSVYDFTLHFIVLIDLIFFTIAYGVEHPKLHNEIRSVEPTLLGWLSAVACYPPLQFLSIALLGWYAPERPEFDSPVLQVALGVPMLALMAAYTWASVALGLKASNLTNRGTVGRGPYAVVRHPAYICKNLFWWVGGLPLAIHSLETGNWLNALLVIGSLAAWTGIYTIRALTEERHLRADAEYREYCQQVKWRYIPRVW